MTNRRESLPYVDASQGGGEERKKLHTEVLR